MLLLRAGQVRNSSPGSVKCFTFKFQGGAHAAYINNSVRAEISRAPNGNIVQNHLNIALLNVF